MNEDEITALVTSLVAPLARRIDALAEPPATVDRRAVEAIAEAIAEGRFVGAPQTVQ